MAERIPKVVGFSDYPHTPKVEVPPEVELNDGFDYSRDEVQEALGRGSDKFTLNIVQVDEGQPPLE